MCPKVAIIYNQPAPGRYYDMGEEKAVVGVLDAVDAVTEALKELGHTLVRMPLLPPLKDAKAKLLSLDADIVFNLFEGFDGQPESEASLADFMTDMGMPYTGCTGVALALASNKAKTKSALTAAGVDTPTYHLATPDNLDRFHIGYPCIVKPWREHASHGLSEKSVVYDFASLKEQVTKVSARFGGKALVEEFLEGREFNATVLDDAQLTVLPISEIVYSLPESMPRVLTFAAKWEPDSLYFQGTQAVCPAEIDESQTLPIIKTAQAAFKVAGCRGYARVDMRMDLKGTLKVLELNPNPDISPGTGAARQAKAAGMTYPEFIERIMTLALKPGNAN